MYQTLETMDETESYRNLFGWQSYRPQYLQIFNSIKWALLFLSMAALIQGIAVNGLLHYFIPMIEKHFRISSTKAGFMSGAYDIASCICLIPVTYYGGQPGARKPFYLGTGAIIIGTGSLIFATPALFAGKFRHSIVTTLCVEEVIRSQNHERDDYYFHYILLIIGNFLHGVGASPLFTLAITYIDENAPLHKSAVYLGIYYMMAIIGPSLGYLVGGYLANVYVDEWIPWRSKNLIPDELNPSSPIWVGSWWIGFLVCALASFIIAIPIFGFPQNLNTRPRDSRIESRISSIMIGSDDLGLTIPMLKTIKGFHYSFCRILRKLKFDFVTCAGFCEGIVLAGMGSFAPKILEQQLGTSNQTTSTVLGAFGIPSALFGILIGGLVIKYFHFELQQMILFCLVVIILSAISSLGLFLYCPISNINGFQSTLNDSKQLTLSKLTFDCNRNCHCDADLYNPICGVNKICYFSPCFAGCLVSSTLQRVTYFHQCKCINVTSSVPVHYEAKNGCCPNTCPQFYIFVALLCLYQFFAFAAAIPALTATLRSVESDLTSLAMGIQWIVVRLLGTIPGPVIFGTVFDRACIVWHSSATGGVCILYDHSILSVYLGCIVIFFKCVEAVFLTVAYFVRIDFYDVL